LIKNDTQRIYGFRYETDNINLAFVIQKPVLKEGGILELPLKSSITLLEETVSYPYQVKGSIAMSTLLSNLDNRFTYTLISPDRNVTLATTTKNDYDVLKQAITYAELWVFRENKLISVGDGLWKTEILIGNFASDIEAYYNASPTTRPECKPDTLTSFQQYDNINDIDQLQAGDIETIYPSVFPNRIFVNGSTGQEGALNSIVVLDPTRITQRADFPLQSVVKNGRTYWYIVNTFASALPIREVFKTYQTSTNNENANGTIEISDTVTAQKLYSYGISYIQSLNYSAYQKVPASMAKKFTLPGNVIRRNIKKTYKGQTIFEINDTGFVNSADAIDVTIIRD
jgi:hypothetical protein